MTVTTIWATAPMVMAVWTSAAYRARFRAGAYSTAISVAPSGAGPRRPASTGPSPKAAMTEDSSTMR